MVKKRCLGAALILFLFFSNEWLATRAYMLWEEPAYPISDIRQPYDVGIIMGGFTDAAKEPRDRVYLNKAVDRMMHAVQLYRMGLVKKLLPSGGSSIPGFTRALEADMIRKAMLNCLVNPEDIIIENRARNTRENAQFSAEIIRNRFPGKPRILVFTSAFHCRRTRASFEKTGLDVDLFPVDFRYNDPGFNVEKALIPSDNAWSMWSILFHEIAGYIVYLCMGYA